MADSVRVCGADLLLKWQVGMSLRVGAGWGMEVWVGQGGVWVVAGGGGLIRQGL